MASHYKAPNRRAYKAAQKRRLRLDPVKGPIIRARELLCSAVKAGRIARGLCEVCGEPKVEGHHDDYSKPLEVRWLCRKHHLELHSLPMPENLR